MAGSTHGLRVLAAVRLAVGLSVRLVEGTLVGVEALGVTLGEASVGTLVLATHVARELTVAVGPATVTTIALGTAIALVPLSALATTLVGCTVVSLVSARRLVQVVSLADIGLVGAVHMHCFEAIHVRVLKASVASVSVRVSGRFLHPCRCTGLLWGCSGGRRPVCFRPVHLNLGCLNLGLRLGCLNLRLLLRLLFLLLYLRHGGSRHLEVRGGLIETNNAAGLWPAQIRLSEDGNSTTKDRLLAGQVVENIGHLLSSNLAVGVGFDVRETTIGWVLVRVGPATLAELTERAELGASLGAVVAKNSEVVDHDFVVLIGIAIFKVEEGSHSVKWFLLEADLARQGSVTALLELANGKGVLGAVGVVPDSVL